MKNPHTFGIEEEFFLTDLASRNIAGNPPAALFAACKREFGAHVSHELLRSQIELSSPVLADVGEARDWLRDSRSRLAARTAEFGLGAIAVGTHPLAQWREQRPTAMPRYERLLDDYQILAQRNLLCGLHVHVAVPETADRVRIMNRVMPWLPMLLALSASSPFWMHKRTGLMSYRQAVYDEWPRTGIPDRFADERAYRRFVEFMARAGALPNASYLWWAIRPSMRYPTLELRIADACPAIEDVLCIAALFRAMVADAMRRRSRDRGRLDMRRLLIEENRWRAKRFGTAALLLDERSGREWPLDEWLNRAERDFGEAAADAGDCGVFAQARRIVLCGSSADRQLRRYGEMRALGSHRRAALRAVVDDLLAEMRIGSTIAT